MNELLSFKFKFEYFFLELIYLNRLIPDTTYNKEGVNMTEHIT